MTLNTVPEGAVVKIVKISAGRGVSSQMHHMGLLEGETVKVVRNTRGHLIVAKDNLRLAIGRGMSHKIEVEAFHG